MSLFHGVYSRLVSNRRQAAERNSSRVAKTCEGWFLSSLVCWSPSP